MARELATSALNPPRGARQNVSVAQAVSAKPSHSQMQVPPVTADRPAPEVGNSSLPSTNPQNRASPQARAPQVRATPKIRPSQIQASPQIRSTAQIRSTVQTQAPPLHNRWRVPLARREQSSPTSHPRAPPGVLATVSPANILRSNTAVGGSNDKDILNTSLRGPPACPVDRDGVCMICKTKHPFNFVCIDFSSEISLRLAIDTLRTGASLPHVQAYRAHLIERLRQLSAKEGASI
ncbi:hypothetical protein F4811DRAFT_421292 [Daldinia bambusicola]|nr:hypothetical protein F4811DRAFT_421292 [Daldinia bambusicola]